jgi:hypothetical protein
MSNKTNHDKLFNLVKRIITLIFLKKLILVEDYYNYNKLINYNKDLCISRTYI